MARIIVGSYVVRFPLGGFQSWMLQWLVGLKRLGHEVYFVEKSAWANSCYDPSTGAMSDDCSYGTAAFHALLAPFGLGEKWCFVDAAGRYHGRSREQIDAAFRTADLFIDHMRVCEWREEAEHARMRVMIDGEPGWTQMSMVNKRAKGLDQMEYDRYYSVGLNVGTAASTVPSAGKQWHPIFDPVATDLFPCVPAPPGAPFTTIMNWQSIKPLEFEGVTYGQKDVEFPKFMDLPRRVGVPMELAIAGESGARGQLQEAGWRLVDAHRTTITFDSWRDYIRNSKGEFGVCKNYFVATNSGEFSDRAAVYLASGRPVVMQETGFSAHLPCGRGLFAVRNVEEAADAIAQIEKDWESHSRAARDIALEYLETGKVLSAFLKDLGISG